VELRPGYKQTEVGVIPEDWDAVPLAALGDFSKGSGVRKDEAKSGDLPCIRYGEIYTHHNDIVRDYHSYISRAVAATAKRLKRGDILFAGSGETKEEIGKAASFVSCAEAYAGGDIVILSPRTCSSEFLGYALNAPEVARQKSSKGQGDAVVHISTSALASISVAVPPLPEQSAIATALSDVDALLAAQDALIAKKRAIKQGAMQELLTGKRRLPGFGGEWEVKRLGELCSLKSGESITSEHIDGTSEFPCYGGNGLRGYTSTATHEGDYALVGRQGALCGNVITASGKFFASEHALVVTPAKTTDIFWLACVLSDANLNQYSESSAQPGLSAAKLLLLDFHAPPTKEEQSAIAEVLSDMDAEITGLETQRAKTAQLKQGMMQELLTGRIRLV
jgi:type I restriction enzyme S subunit